MPIFQPRTLPELRSQTRTRGGGTRSSFPTLGCLTLVATLACDGTDPDPSAGDPQPVNGDEQPSNGEQEPTNGEEQPSNGQTAPPEFGDPKTTRLSGVVTTNEGQGLSGVRVTSGRASTTTDDNGVFSLSSVTVREALGTVEFEKDGFFSVDRSFAPGAEESRLAVALLPRTSAGRVGGSQSGQLQTDGVSFDFRGARFTRNGQPYDGEVEVFHRYIDPADPNIARQIPGQLLAVSESGPLHLTTFGMSVVELEDAEGNTVDLTDSSVRMEMPVPPELADEAPDTIDWWSLGDDGLWVREGSATRQGDVYVAEARHFSAYNLDIPRNAARVRGRVDGANGALVDLEIIIDGAPQPVVPSDGQTFDFFAPADEPFDLRIVFPCGTGASTLFDGEIGPLQPGFDLVELESLIFDRGGLSTVQARLVDCTGAPTTNAYVLRGTSVIRPDPNGVVRLEVCRGDSSSFRVFQLEPARPTSEETFSAAGDLLDLGDIEVCPNDPPDGAAIDIDGNQYGTVTIGDQTWTAENLQVTRLVDGTPLANPSIETFFTEPGPAYIAYEESDERRETFGLLYNWAAVATGQLCPAGWHVPDDAEWDTLFAFVGDDEGGKLKALTEWNEPNLGATNEFGFSALPGGRADGPGFFSIGNQGYFWSTEERNDAQAFARTFFWNFSFVNRSALPKSNGFSVRCVAD